MGSPVCVEPLVGAEVGDVESPGATEAGHWLVPVATPEANMRSPGRACALEKRGAFSLPLPGCLQKAQPGREGALD